MDKPRKKQMIKTIGIIIISNVSISNPLKKDSVDIVSTL